MPWTTLGHYVVMEPPPLLRVQRYINKDVHAALSIVLERAHMDTNKGTLEILMA